MANRYFDPRKRFLRNMELEENVRHFRGYCRREEQTIGEFLVEFIILWKKTKGSDVTDYEASYRLLKEMPSVWAPWVRIQIWETLTYDPVTFLPSGHFIELASRVFLQWLRDDGPPIVIEGQEKTSGIEEAYARALEVVHPVGVRIRESRELGKRPVVESSTESSPVWRGRHDYEAGTSGVKRRAMGTQTDAEEEVVLSEAQPQQESAQQISEQLSTEKEEAIRTGTPAPITLSDLREAEQQWIEQSEETSEVQVLPSPTPEPVPYVIISDDEEQGSEQARDDETEPEIDEDIVDLSSD